VRAGNLTAPIAAAPRQWLSGGGTPADVSGTLRTRYPEETWDLVRRILPEWGVTRVADLTDLDIVGIPVFSAIRPSAATVAVSAGKGATRLLAKISAAMEAVEVAVAERYRPEARVTAPAAALDLPYEVTALQLQRLSLVTQQARLEWAAARGLLSGADTPLPCDAIGLRGWAAEKWSPRKFVTSTNGLASGNDAAEACLHAVLELVEREAIAGFNALPIHERVYLDLDSVADDANQALLESLRRAGMWCEVVLVPSLRGTSTFAAYLWHADMPDLYVGSGSHVLPEIALSRALTEAAQSRLSIISGARDDVHPATYRLPCRSSRPAVAASAIKAPMPQAGTRHPTIAAALTDVVAAIEQRTGQVVLVVEMARPGRSLSVCQVFAPGLRFDAWTQLARPSSSIVRSRSAE